MKQLLSTGFILLCLSAWGQIHAGKTEAQILSMGLTDWMDYYGGQLGSSTASMCESATIYGEAAAHRNDRLLAKKTARERARVASLRKLMGRFGSASVDIAFAQSGGGTMFNPMWASVSGIVEDTLYGMIAHAGGRAPRMVVSMVTKQLDKLSKELEDQRRTEGETEYFKYGEAKKALAEMRSTYAAIVKIAGHLPRQDSDRLLSFCLERARVPDSLAGE